MGKQRSITIQSDSLFIRPWEEGDRDVFHQVMSDPKVHIFTNEEPWTEEITDDAMRWFMANQCGWNWIPGYFNCPLILKGTGELIGRVGLNPFREEENIPEIEWTIGPDHWGKGYATEIGMAVLQYGFKEARFDTIMGFAFPENKASRRVMEKIGMRYLGDENYRNKIFSFYRIDKDDIVFED